MKKLLFIFFIFVSLFSSCSEETATDVATTDEPNKVLLLKVDYLTNIFQGGKETTYSENSNSFTISHQIVAPVDFGNIKLKYDEINQILFDGDAVRSNRVHPNKQHFCACLPRFEFQCAVDFVRIFPCRQQDCQMQPLLLPWSFAPR